MSVIEKSLNNEAIFAQTSQLLKKAGSDSVLYVRLLAVRLALLGANIKKVAQALFVSPSAVRKWVRICRKEGAAGLIRKEGSGRKPILSKADKEEIQKVLAQPPQKQGFEVWSGKNLSAYIEKRFGKKLSIRSCQSLIKESGYTYAKAHSTSNSKRASSRKPSSSIQEKESEISTIYILCTLINSIISSSRNSKEGNDQSKPNQTPVSMVDFIFIFEGQSYIYPLEPHTSQALIKDLQLFLKDFPLTGQMRYQMNFSNLEPDWIQQLEQTIWKNPETDYQDIKKWIIPEFWTKEADK